jgi:hypothetical protein
MNGETHSKAERLILQEHVEGIAAAEREWLDRHLEGCPACARIAAATGQTLRRMRAVSVPLPPGLAGRAQMRVYLRAQKRVPKRAGWMVWAACGGSWAMGIVTAPYVWRGFRWLGSSAGLPDLVWKTGFGLWWAAPALLAVVILLAEKWGREERTDNAGL